MQGDIYFKNHVAVVNKCYYSMCRTSPQLFSCQGGAQTLSGAHKGGPEETQQRGAQRPHLSEPHWPPLQRGGNDDARAQVACRAKRRVEKGKVFKGKRKGV